MSGTGHGHMGYMRSAMPERSEAELRALDNGVHTVEAAVTVLVPEFEQVELETTDGYALAITEHTAGVDWRTLRKGQRLSCHVRGVLTPKVLSASILA
jgi:hypothetical protein